MTKLIWCGSVVVETASLLVSVPAMADSLCWLTTGLLGLIPFGYAIAAGMLATSRQMPVEEWNRR